MWQPLKGKLEEAKQRPYSGPEGPQEELREKTGVCRAAGLRELEIKGKSVLNEASGILAANMNDEEGNGTPLQYSCLENPMGGGA